jgi:hypothetical protein
MEACAYIRTRLHPDGRSHAALEPPPMHSVTPPMRVALETTLQDWLRFEIRRHAQVELTCVLLSLPEDVRGVLFKFVILRIPRQTVQLYAPVARNSLAQRISTIANPRVSALLQLVLNTLDDASSSFLLHLST